tara:strand:+ start:4296 stop:4499 length:204 start_codon:yes stop_codon:yes gene_type:complete
MKMTLMDYIQADIDAELHEYTKHERDINWKLDLSGKFYEGMLAGRHEFAEQLSDLINKWRIKHGKRK